MRLSRLTKHDFFYTDDFPGRNEGGARTWSAESRDTDAGNFLCIDSIRREKEGSHSEKLKGEVFAGGTSLKNEPAVRMTCTDVGVK
jgi:hypothetical protein